MYRIFLLFIVHLFVIYSTCFANIPANLTPQQQSKAQAIIQSNPNILNSISPGDAQQLLSKTTTKKETNKKKEINQKDIDTKDPSDTSQIETIFSTTESLDTKTNLFQIYYDEPFTTKKSDSFVSPLIQKAKQFGYDFFSSSQDESTDFNIPVADDYIIGPGDSLVINIWGKLTETFMVTVDKRGRIFIPQLGHIPLNGVRFGQVNNIIRKHLDKKFVNIETSVSISQLRSIKVFILGDVNQPGSYNVSSLSTLFTAIHEAGGPSKTGSLRNIQLKRKGKTFKTVDLYDYLLKGDQSQDIQLRAYDTIFVPAIGPVCQIKGLVKRPAIYELKHKVSLLSAIQLSGGFHASSYPSLIQVERLSNGKKVEVINVSSKQAEFKKIAKRFLIKDGDRIHVLPILNEKDNVVTVKGSVNRPGSYQFKKGMTLDQLLSKAQDLKEISLNRDIQVYRYLTHTQRELLLVSQDRAKSFTLKKWDIVNVEENQYGFVTVKGSVIKPGKYKLLANMKVSDVIELSQLDATAELSACEVYRQSSLGESIITVSLSEIIANPDSDENLYLHPNDLIMVQENKFLVEKRQIQLSGAFKQPGTYFFRENETLNSVIKRAGGLSDNAFITGAVFTRQSVKVAEEQGNKRIVDEEQKRLIYDQRRLENLNEGNKQAYQQAISFLQTKIESSDGRVVIDLNEILNDTIEFNLEDGDTLTVPTVPDSIQIVGGVSYPTSLRYVNGKGLNYYIKKAGGLSEFSIKDTFYVFKSNGQIAKNNVNIQKGDTIYIPEEVKVKLNVWKETKDVIKVIFEVVSIMNVFNLIR
ncbi:hypothetical protein DID75_00235 [Candidatus Marinamargulisbacteria bacterium SCGC AG-410-N11]|nr:hypothetical protein DID75_00235 [Candidatus Marinamargulisbacteria bacterium SCGC AG-410-N11]